MSLIDVNELMFAISLTGETLLTNNRIVAHIGQLGIKYSKNIKYGIYPDYIKDINKVLKRAIEENAPSKVEFTDTSRKNIKITIDLSTYTYSGDEYIIILDMETPPDEFVSYSAFQKERINNYLLHLQHCNQIKQLTRHVSYLERLHTKKEFKMRPNADILNLGDIA